MNVFKHTFYTYGTLSDSSFIGHKGKAIQTFIKDLKSEISDLDYQSGLPFRRVNQGDLSISIDEENYHDDTGSTTIEESSQKFIDTVDQDKFSDFIGWPPSTEEYEEFVKITLSAYMNIPLISSLLKLI